MIEEAAGTRMYESKKQSAQRTIEKKDSKLQEIETVRKIKISMMFHVYVDETFVYGNHWIRYYPVLNWTVLYFFPLRYLLKK